MTARVVVARPDDAALIAEAAAILRSGGLVGLPTETVYGLGARALDPVALAKVFAAKGRPHTHPLIAHVLDLDGARAVAETGPLAERLAARFWPGPLTLVLPRRAGTPDLLSAGLPTVAVRAPAHPVARAVIAALGEPIAAPSANRYQAVSPTSAVHVAQGLGDAVELILDGGPTARGIESTVVDLSGPPRLLRLGPIPASALREILPQLEVETSGVPGEAARPSPGMDARHYAPRATARLFVGDPPSRTGDAVLWCGAARDAHGAQAMTLPAEPTAYAAGLYAALHTLDDTGAARIFIEAVPEGEAWDAIRDRLARATHR